MTPIVALATHDVAADLTGQAPRVLQFAPGGMRVSPGEHDAVGEGMGVRCSGSLAGLLWNAVHLSTLVGVHKPRQVALDWSLAEWVPCDSAIIRRPSRRPICARAAEAARVRDAAA